MSFGGCELCVCLMLAGTQQMEGGCSGILYLACNYQSKCSSGLQSARLCIPRIQGTKYLASEMCGRQHADLTGFLPNQRRRSTTSKPRLTCSRPFSHNLFHGRSGMYTTFVPHGSGSDCRGTPQQSLGMCLCQCYG